MLSRLFNSQRPRSYHSALAPSDSSLPEADSSVALSTETVHSSMDILWCGSRTKRKDKTIDSIPAALPDDRRFQSTTQPKASDKIPEVNIDLDGMETLSVLINRGRQGFGFTVSGSSPVQVGRVEEGSPAFKAGLRRKDCIARINGQNVSRSMAESVARIVRETEGVLRLEVQRSSTGNESPTSSTWQLYDETPRLSVCEPNLAPPEDTPLNQQRFSIHGKPQLPPRRPFTSLVNFQATPRLKLANEASMCSPKCDQMSSCSELSRFTVPETIVGLCPRRAQSMLRTKKAPMPLPVGETIRPETKQDSREKMDDAEETEEENEKDAEGKEFLKKDRTQSPATDDKKISSYEQVQWPAILKLIACEEEFVLQMQAGLQKYLLPFRQTFLTPEQDFTVFQNLEEIISFSQYHLNELHSHLTSSSSCQEMQTVGERGDCSGQDVGVDERLSVGALTSVYLKKIESFCGAYESYCPGVMNAFHILASLKRSNPEIQTYLKKVVAQDVERFTISAFLQKPIEHIKDLVLGLQKILCYMQVTTSDYTSLQHVVRAMRNCCLTINANHIQRCNSSMSSLSSTESTPMKSFSSSSSSSNSAAAASVVSSIDTEVLAMQSRLVFPENVRTFHLATASHHMIYSGRLTLIDGGSNVPLFVALLSDLLVLTRPDPISEKLCVLEEPILLQDVVGCNFSCVHHCEFVMSVETPLTSLQNSWTPRALVMRAPSFEIKCTWKNILEQRISACKAQREVSISNRWADKLV